MHMLVECLPIHSKYLKQKRWAHQVHQRVARQRPNRNHLDEQVPRDNTRLDWDCTTLLLCRGQPPAVWSLSSPAKGSSPRSWLPKGRHTDAQSANASIWQIDRQTDRQSDQSGKEKKHGRGGKKREVKNRNNTDPIRSE